MKRNIKYEVGEGWIPLVEEANTIIAKYNFDHSSQEFPLEFTQIKEKWGGLCLYVNQYIPEISNKLHDLENKSYEICENCGTNKNVKTEYTHGWVMTLCDKCRKEENDEYNKVINHGK